VLNPYCIATATLNYINYRICTSRADERTRNTGTPKLLVYDD
jgi:hypothetical protein